MTIIDSLGGLSGTFWSTLIGAVVGAIVAGSLSLAIQIYAVSVARRERTTSKRQEDLAVAFTATVKLIRILTELANAKQNCDVAVAQSLMARNEGMQMWSALRPFPTDAPEINFSEAEAAFVLSSKDRHLMLAVLEAADNHNELKKLLLIYRMKREAFTAKVPPGRVTGKVAERELTESQRLELEPYRIELNDLAVGINNRVSEAFPRICRTFSLFKQYCGTRFGNDYPSLLIDPPNAAADPPAP